MARTPSTIGRTRGSDLIRIFEREGYHPHPDRSAGTGGGLVVLRNPPHPPILIRPDIDYDQEVILSWLQLVGMSWDRFLEVRRGIVN